MDAHVGGGRGGEGEGAFGPFHIIMPSGAIGGILFIYSSDSKQAFLNFRPH